ncbi:hypothetical protein AK812_SmicGene602 [Symbiodinium microadriaticum]|uniref:Uncharacterized protein n=1 Tax=Symbiodinium microadriaticum TaxID=2951 RepID=A0A1Q9F6C6_SYMMI|nr:hypothetical protein AK812_SmicGene602 [Symbiodinium microadriaticum]
MEEPSEQTTGTQGVASGPEVVDLDHEARIRQLEALVESLQQRLSNVERNHQLPNIPNDEAFQVQAEEVLRAEAASGNLDIPMPVKDGEGAMSPVSPGTSARGQRVSYTEVDRKARESYEWQASTWDLALFVGTDVLGKLGGVHTVILLLLTVFIQLVFVVIVQENFSQPLIDQSTVLDASRWRLSTGHRVFFYDSLTQASLVSRVCNFDSALDVSQGQVGWWTLAYQYLRDDQFFAGPVLAMVAVTLWFLMVSGDVVKTLDGGLVLDTEDEDEPKYTLTNLSRARKVWGAMLLLIRGSVACVLLYSGIALEIVLNVDDLLFNALAATPARYDPGSHDLSTALCGGKQNFVWVEDPLRMVSVAETWAYDSADQTVRNAHERNPLYIIVNDVVTHDINGTARLGSWQKMQDKRALDAWAEVSLSEAVDEIQPECQDAGSNHPGWYYLENILRRRHDEEGPPPPIGNLNCQTVARYCTSVSLETTWAPDDGRGIMTRMLCPDTCGCWSSVSPRLINTGCPTTCRAYDLTGESYKMTGRTSEFARFNCSEDMSLANINRDYPGVWEAWVEQLRAYSVVSGEAATQVAEIADEMEEYGCDISGNYTEIACYFDNPSLSEGQQPFQGSLGGH